MYNYDNCDNYSDIFVFYFFFNNFILHKASAILNFINARRFKFEKKMFHLIDVFFFF